MVNSVASLPEQSPISRFADVEATKPPAGLNRTFLLSSTSAQSPSETTITPEDLNFRQYAGTGGGQQVLYGQIKGSDQWVALTPDGKGGYTKTNIGDVEPPKEAVQQLIRDGVFPILFDANGRAVDFKPTSTGSGTVVSNDKEKEMPGWLAGMAKTLKIDSFSGADLNEKLDNVPEVVNKLIPQRLREVATSLTPGNVDHTARPQEITTADFNERAAAAEAKAANGPAPTEGDKRTSTRRIDDGGEPGGLKTSVDLEARQVFKDGEWQTEEYVAVGPLITRDGVLVSQRRLEFPLINSIGNPITELPAAAAKAFDMMAKGEVSTLSPEQKAYAERGAIAKEKELQDLVSRLPKETTLGSALVSPADPGDPLAPNLIRGGQEAPGITRHDWFTSVTTTTENPEPSLTYMFVPNIVYKGGFTTKVGKPLPDSGFSVGPGWQKLFIPLTDFLDGGYETRTTSSILHKVEHKGGFYPSDGGSYFNPFDEPQFHNRFGHSLDVDPLAPAFTDRRFGSRIHRDVNDFQQFYLNANYMLDASSYSLNYRNVPHRYEERLAFRSGSEVSKSGVTASTLTGAPYTWIQGPQVQVGFSPQPFAFAGEQVEFGAYGYLESVKVGQLTGDLPKSATDWHIVDGKISEGREGWKAQFSDVESSTGIVLRSQSIVPSEGDNTAPVFVKPNQEMVVTKLNGQGEGVVTTEQLADALSGAADLNPDKPELRYITPEALVELNKNKVVIFYNPDTEVFTRGFQVGDWIETNVAVSLGGPGLYVKPETLPDGSIAPDGTVIPASELAHNKNN